MPTTVTSSSGTVYHLWQLPELSSPEPSESIAFNTLRNDLGDGYRSQVLFGSNTGLRSWSLRLPTLASIDVLPNTVTGINGESVSREQYVWDLYCEQQVTGDPFVYTSPRNGQYYLVEFVDEKLTYEQARVKLYSTGLELRQVRISGETVFTPELIASSDTYTPVLWMKGSGYTDGTELWTLSSSGGYLVGGSGNVNKSAAAQNGQDVVQLNVGATNDGYVGDFTGPLEFKEAFIVMKMREATFSNAATAGIFTDSGASGQQVLIGANGATVFTNPSLSPTAFTYRYNGIEYAQSNMVAPMNTWGVIHLRYTTGYNLATGFQFGKNRTAAGTYAEMDLGEVICFTSLLSGQDSRELTEHLTVKWGIV